MVKHLVKKFSNHFKIVFKINTHKNLFTQYSSIPLRRRYHDFFYKTFINKFTFYTKIILYTQELKQTCLLCNFYI